MNISELRTALAEHGVQSRAFSLGDDRKLDEQYRLEESKGLWIVCYLERGNMTDEHWFATEDEACRYFFDRLLNDPTTRR
jgi:hypothetical protein